MTSACECSEGCLGGVAWRVCVKSLESINVPRALGAAPPGYGWECGARAPTPPSLAGADPCSRVTVLHYVWSAALLDLSIAAAGSIHPCCCVVRARCSPYPRASLTRGAAVVPSRGGVCVWNAWRVGMHACRALRLACMHVCAHARRACMRGVRAFIPCEHALPCRACIHAWRAGMHVCGHACMRARGVCALRHGPLRHASHLEGCYRS